MTGYNKKAWKLLLEDEQLALSLRYGHGKSTWEAGEIMERAHYKFLEIEARAQHFLKMFSEHLTMYDTVIPSYVKIDKRFRKYLNYAIKQRMKTNEAVAKVDKIKFTITSVRDKIIIDEMERLVNSKSVVDKNFALMVFEFDRWNNFRILPKEIQEPSAFKRRNKNNDKNNIKNLLTMNTFTVEQIIKRYSYTSKTRKPNNLLYVPIFSKFVDYADSIIEVEHSDDTARELSRVGLYLFTRPERAEQFLDLLYNYNFDEPKNPVEGQLFWPKFRQMTGYALNYNNIRKRIASRKFLESALKDLDLQLLNPKNKDPNKARKRLKKNKKLGI